MAASLEKTRPPNRISQWPLTVHQVPHPGHAAPPAVACTQMLTRPPLISARSTATADRCGSNTASTPASTPDKDTLTCDTDMAGLPGSDD